MMEEGKQSSMLGERERQREEKEGRKALERRSGESVLQMTKKPRGRSSELSLPTCECP
jgi:hypothetical protein